MSRDIDRLKPCPFCGHAAHLYEDEEIHEWFVECSQTADVCPVHSMAGPFKTHDEAIAAWHRRPGTEDAFAKEARKWLMKIWDGMVRCGGGGVGGQTIESSLASQTWICRINGLTRSEIVTLLTDETLAVPAPQAEGGGS